MAHPDGLPDASIPEEPLPMLPAQRPMDALPLAQHALDASDAVHPDVADALPALPALADAPSAERSVAPELAFLAQAAAALPAEALALCTPAAVQSAA